MQLVPVDWSSIEAVVFDMGGVFLVRHEDPVRRGMARAGFDLPEDDGSNYHDAHYYAVRAMSELLVQGAIDEASREFWIQFDREYFRRLGVVEDRLDEAARAVNIEVFSKEPHPIWRKLLPANIAALRRFERAGIPMAIVTNNDGTAVKQLADYGIAQIGPGDLTSVVSVVDSSIVGIAKPDPRIFEPALAALGTRRSQTLYVGDTVHADVHGASRAGMPVVQLDPLDLHADHTHARTKNVDEIASLMGVH